jgi:hypothetical protein
MTQHITQDPDPCVPGDKVKFCFSLDGVQLPTTLNGTWDPGGQKFSHTVTSASDNCWEETVPADAEGGDIEDAGGWSETFAISVAP